MDNTKNKESFNVFLLVLISFFFAIVNVFTIFKGHNWGGDFSQYIIHAKNLLLHRGYADNISLNPEVIYPPGFPVIIVPILYFWGLNFFALKVVNIIFWYAFIFVFYGIAKERIGKTLSLLCCAFLSVSSEFFYFKQNILSDIPFLFFSTCAISLFLKYDSSDRRNLFPAILLMIISMLIRSAGVVLFMSALYYLFFIKRRNRDFMFVLIALVGTILFQKCIVGLNPGFFINIFNDPIFYLTSAIKQSSHPFRSILWAICPGQTLFSQAIFRFIDRIIMWISPILYLVIIILFIRKTIKKNLSYLGCFFVFYLSMLFVWASFSNTATEYVRFVYPILGLLLIFILEMGIIISKKTYFSMNLSQIIPFFMKAGMIIIIAINILNIWVIRNFNDDVLFKKNNSEMFSWVRNNVKSNEYYMIWKPRPTALMTDRIGTAPWITVKKHPFLSFIERIEKYKISYIILSKDVDKFLMGICKDNPKKFMLVWKNEGYNIYKVIR